MGRVFNPFLSVYSMSIIISSYFRLLILNPDSTLPQNTTFTYQAAEKIKADKKKYVPRAPRSHTAGWWSPVGVHTEHPRVVPLLQGAAAGAVQPAGQGGLSVGQWSSTSLFDRGRRRTIRKCPLPLLRTLRCNAHLRKFKIQVGPPRLNRLDSFVVDLLGLNSLSAALSSKALAQSASNLDHCWLVDFCRATAYSIL